MELHTKYHGVIEVDETAIITFEKGIPGFLEETGFILLAMDEQSPFFILQSVKTPELGFVVTNPFHFFKEYEFDLADADKDKLKIDEKTEIHVLTILTVKEPFSETTANLQAPIIINQNDKLAKQIILNNPSYTTKHQIIQKAVHK